MNALALTLYHRLPAPLRSVAASARGLRLRHWRYGADTAALVQAALDRERWSDAQWQRWREDRLSRLLHRAATAVPYYREQWAARRRRGDSRPVEVLANWPILSKDAVRASAAQFVADDCQTSKMFHEHTSGTTGTSLNLWWSRRTVREWYALFEARCRMWYGVSRHDRWAILGGQLVTPVAQQRPPFWVWNAALHQLYMSTYHLAPEHLPAYLDALVQHRITYLWGYPSSLYELALGALHSGRATTLPLKVVITNAEPLLPYQRETIRKAFGCDVRETYGMAEIVAAASECEAGQMHEWPEVGIVEVLDDGHPVPRGTAGDLVATGLLNVDMPLIRYAVGDRISLSASPAACRCGRTAPLVAAIEGRSDDTLVTRDGRRIGRLDPVFKAGLPIREAQIIQETLDRLRVRFVPALDFTPAAERALEQAIRARVGDMQIVLESLPAIPRTANGKFRAVICQVPAAERLQVPA